MYYNSDYLLRQLSQQNQIITARITALENLLSSKGYMGGTGSSGGTFSSSFARSVDSCVNVYCLFGDPTSAANTANLETIKDQISFQNIGFQNLVNGSYMFSYQPLTEINLNSALFNNIMDSSYMFYYSSLETINMPNATFANLQDAGSMFYNMQDVTSIKLPKATFAKVVNAVNMFNGCPQLVEIDLSSATFESLEVGKATNMFATVGSGCSVKIPETTFEKLKAGSGPFSSGWTYSNGAATKS